MTHVVALDDRERSPNYGKPRFNPATVIATPPMWIVGVKLYFANFLGVNPAYEVFVENLPKELAGWFKVKAKPISESLVKLEAMLPQASKVSALCVSVPRSAGLAQKRPHLIEIDMIGGDLKTRVDYVKERLGKTIRFEEFVKPGESVDVAVISKGHGVEGPITRLGVKKKQHKSRKSVRAVAVIGPWHPAAVMYTVPRGGQMGFHQRTDLNKKVLMVGNSDQAPITPASGFRHFGIVKGDYVVMSGSIPGPARRPAILKLPMRVRKRKIRPPTILKVSGVGE